MRYGLAILIVLSLTACSAHGPAPVSDRYQSSEVSPDAHRVSRGDTLFSIAFRYGTTVERLAAINGIKPPYTIYIDQRLKLVGSGPVKAVEKPISYSPKVVSKPIAKRPRPVTAATKPIQHIDSVWYWPLKSKGSLTARFKEGSTSNKGIDIAAARGTPVLASRAGTVVYAGSSLPGYGNLLIIKHDSEYLSAYAHNERLLVKEGDAVSAKQHIANLGSTSSPSPKLHFEIRRDGKPIDPLVLLQSPQK